MADLKIYVAERQVASKSHKKDYVKWLERVFLEMGEPLPKIKNGQGTRIARGGKAVLNLPRWSRTEITMLHEVAHCVQVRHTGVSKHNKEFKEIVLGLVGWFVSEKKMQQLDKAYRTQWI